MLKIEVLERSAVETEILWNNKYGEIAARFIREYKELLNTMHEQQVYITAYKKDNDPPLSTELDKFSRQFAERTGLFRNIDRLKDTFQKINKNSVEQHLRKSLRL